MEPFALQQAKADDDLLAEIYGKAGVAVHDETDADLAKWKAIAQDTAWKVFAARNASCAAIMQLATEVA